MIGINYWYWKISFASWTKAGRCVQVCGRIFCLAICLIFFHFSLLEDIEWSHTRCHTALGKVIAISPDGAAKKLSWCRPTNDLCFKCGCWTGRENTSLATHNGFTRLRYSRKLRTRSVTFFLVERHCIELHWWIVAWQFWWCSCIMGTLVKTFRN